MTWFKAILLVAAATSFLDALEVPEKFYQNALGHLERGNIKSAKKALEILCNAKMEKACNKLKELSSSTTNEIGNEKTSNVPLGTKKPIKHIASDTTSFVLSNSFKSLKADLDHDGKLEIVTWKKSATSELGDFYQLIVLDDDGSVLWKGPNKADETNPLMFFSLDTGESLPQVLTDFDLDGNIELLAAMAQSDVSPTYYRKLRWRGSYFEPLLQNALMMKKRSSSEFIWKLALKPEGTWVSKLTPVKSKLFKAEITSMNSNGEVSGGEVLIEFIRGGAVVKSIIKPIRQFGETTQNNIIQHSDNFNATYTSQPMYSAPIQKSNTYRARISNKDHYNSRGIKLRKLASILHQDRANYYKYGGDKEDQPDKYFHTARSRNIIEHIHINPIGSTYRKLKDIILNGTPLLEIEVESRQLNVKVIKR